MVSNGSVPWYNVPAREFPIKRWLRQRYGFILPPLVFARPAAQFWPGAAALQRREFPAQRWLRARQAGA